MKLEKERIRHRALLRVHPFAPAQSQANLAIFAVHLIRPTRSTLGFQRQASNSVLANRDSARRQRFALFDFKLGAEALEFRCRLNQLRALADSKSAHFKATRRRLPVGAVFFYRNADDFSEQCLDD